MKMEHSNLISSLIPTTWFRVGVDRNDLSVPISRAIPSKWLFGVGINLTNLIDKQKLFWLVRDQNTNKLQGIGLIRAAISLWSRWVILYEFHKQVVCHFNENIKHTDSSWWRQLKTITTMSCRELNSRAYKSDAPLMSEVIEAEASWRTNR